MLKLVYLLVAFGVVIPFLLGLLVELYIIMPLKTPVTEAPVIFFFQVCLERAAIKSFRQLLGGSKDCNHKVACTFLKVNLYVKFQDWALGIMYMKIIHRILMMLPANDWQRAITAVSFHGRIVELYQL